MNILIKVVTLMMVLVIIGCSGPRPILYPNAHLKEVGQSTVERDIAECRAMAKAAGATPKDSRAIEAVKRSATNAGIGAASGAIGGAIVGSAGVGAAIGAVGSAAMSGLQELVSGSSKQPNQVYINFVNRCLKERGYEPVGWE